MLISDRPPVVNILSLGEYSRLVLCIRPRSRFVFPPVRDAIARLPNGEGTRAKVRSKEKKESTLVVVYYMRT